MSKNKKYNSNSEVVNSLQDNGIRKKKVKKNPPEDFDIDECSAQERMKYEVAMELGLYEQVLEDGWRSLSSKQAGKIGGIVSRRRKQIQKDQSEEEV